MAYSFSQHCLVPVAANASSGAKKFATKETKFTESETLYNLVQCTPDLSSFDCRRCLWGAITNLSNSYGGKRGEEFCILVVTLGMKFSRFTICKLKLLPHHQKGKAKSQPQ